MLPRKPVTEQDGLRRRDTHDLAIELERQRERRTEIGSWKPDLSIATGQIPGFTMRPREKCAAVPTRSLSISMACFARWIATQKSSYRFHGGNWRRLAWLVSWRRSRVRAQPPVRLRLCPLLNHLQHSPNPPTSICCAASTTKGHPRKLHIRRVPKPDGSVSYGKCATYLDNRSVVYVAAERWRLENERCD